MVCVGGGGDEWLFSAKWVGTTHSTKGGLGHIFSDPTPELSLSTPNRPPQEPNRSIGLDTQPLRSILYKTVGAAHLNVDANTCAAAKFASTQLPPRMIRYGFACPLPVFNIWHRLFEDRDDLQDKRGEKKQTDSKGKQTHRHRMQYIWHCCLLLPFLERQVKAADPPASTRLSLYITPRGHQSPSAFHYYSTGSRPSHGRPTAHKSQINCRFTPYKKGL